MRTVLRAATGLGIALIALLALITVAPAQPAHACLDTDSYEEDGIEVTVVYNCASNLIHEFEARGFAGTYGHFELWGPRGWHHNDSDSTDGAADAGGNGEHRITRELWCARFWEYKGPNHYELRSDNICVTM